MNFANGHRQLGNFFPNHATPYRCQYRFYEFQCGFHDHRTLAINTKKCSCCTYTKPLHATKKWLIDSDFVKRP